MKKGKVFGKGQAVFALMILALGAAVWLNMKFTSQNKYLGEAKYVGSETSSKAVETAAKTDESENDYFKNARDERKAMIEETEKLVAEMLDSDKLTEADKKAAMDKVTSLTERLENENNIELLLKAKGFSEAVAVIGDDNANIVVKSDGLTTAQTLQIQDVVTTETKIELGKIKIVTVK